MCVRGPTREQTARVISPRIVESRNIRGRSGPSLTAQPQENGRDEMKPHGDEFMVHNLN